MQALQWHAAGRLSLDEVFEPAGPRPGDALVEVAYCGVCGTDLAEFRAGPVLIRTSAHPLTGAVPPLALGHEISGHLVALGPDTPGPPIGARVAVDPCWRCGVCEPCRTGQYQVCVQGGSVGLASPGGLARFVIVPAAGLSEVPAAVELDVAALAEPLAVGLHAVSRAEVSPGATVAVLGGGPVGAACLLAARASGATRLVVVEPAPTRRELAHVLGADHTLDPADGPIHRQIKSITDGVGADVVIEASGVPSALEAALKSATRRGTVVVPAIGKDSYVVDGRQIVLHERRVIGTLGYNYDLPRVLALVATRRMDPRPLITGVVGLDEAAAAITRLAEHPEDHMKLLVRPGGTD